MDSALVLGAGGITGIAWQLGLITGLREAGVDLTTADLLVGTSAGSVTGTLLAAGVDPVEAQRLEARLGDSDPPIRPDWARGSQAFSILNDEERDPASIRAAVGEPVTWERSSDVPLDRAVAASCAVPCIFPPVTIGASHYVDGGVRSGTNADLATGASRIVVLAPLAPVRMRGAPAEEIDALRRDAKAVLIGPDEAALEALGPNVFDMARWEPAIEAATGQGHRAAAEVASMWRAD